MLCGFLPEPPFPLVLTQGPSHVQGPEHHSRGREPYLEKDFCSCPFLHSQEPPISSSPWAQGAAGEGEGSPASSPLPSQAVLGFDQLRALISGMQMRRLSAGGRESSRGWQIGLREFSVSLAVAGLAGAREEASTAREVQGGKLQESAKQIVPSPSAQVQGGRGDLVA